VSALNAATGAKRWSFNTGRTIISSPAVSGGNVYIGAENGSVYALNAATGAKQWSHRLPPKDGVARCLGVSYELQTKISFADVPALPSMPHPCAGLPETGLCGEIWPTG
jgi:glucose dehydrogenase